MHPAGHSAVSSVNASKSHTIRPSSGVPKHAGVTAGTSATAGSSVQPAGHAGVPSVDASRSQVGVYAATAATAGISIALPVHEAWMTPAQLPDSSLPSSPPQLPDSSAATRHGASASAAAARQLRTAPRSGSGASGIPYRVSSVAAALRQVRRSRLQRVCEMRGAHSCAVACRSLAPKRRNQATSYNKPRRRRGGDLQLQITCHHHFPSMAFYRARKGARLATMLGTPLPRLNFSYAADRRMVYGAPKAWRRTSATIACGNGRAAAGPEADDRKPGTLSRRAAAYNPQLGGPPSQLIN